MEIVSNVNNTLRAACAYVIDLVLIDRAFHVIIEPVFICFGPNFVLLNVCIVLYHIGSDIFLEKVRPLRIDFVDIRKSSIDSLDKNPDSRISWHILSLNIDIEIINDKTPKTWTKQLI